MAGGLERRSRKEFFHQQPPLPLTVSNNVLATVKHRTAKPPKDARFAGRFTRTRRGRIPHVVDTVLAQQAVVRHRHIPKLPPPYRGRVRRGIAARLSATAQAFLILKRRVARQGKMPVPFRGRVLHGKVYRLNATTTLFVIFKRRYGRQVKGAPPPVKGKFGRGKAARLAATVAFFLVVKRRSPKRTPDVRVHVTRTKLRRDETLRRVFIDSNHMLCGGLLGGL